MKKLLLTSFAGLAMLWQAKAQIAVPDFLYNSTNVPIETPHEIYSQNDAVYTRSANLDIAGTDKSRIGIVYETIDGKSYLYMTNYISDINNQYLNTNRDAFATEMEIDDNSMYEVRHADIRIIPGNNPFETITLIVYQRRLRNTTNDYEIMFRIFEANEDFSWQQLNPETTIDIGKGATIDAFVNIDKNNPNLNTSSFGDFAIAYSNMGGYTIQYLNLMAGSIVPTLIDQSNIPITIYDPTYSYNDDVYGIDIATVTKYSNTAYIGYNTIYAIYSSTNSEFSVASWDVDPSMPGITSPVNMLIGSAPFPGFSTLSGGASISRKCKIEAMSIQEIDEPVKFIAFGEHDLSGYNQLIGKANFTIPTLPPLFVEEEHYYGNNDFHQLVAASIIYPVAYYGKMHGLDITAGIGNLGDNNYFNNRQFSIHREYSTTNLDEITLFRKAIPKNGITTGNAYPLGSTDIYNFIEIVSNSPYYGPANMFGNGGNSYVPSNHIHYAFQHVSNAASLNTGAFILTAWVERGNVYFKSFNDHDDIDVSNFYSPRWNQKLAPTVDAAIRIIPNPASNQFLVSAHAFEMSSIAVVDMMGRTVATHTPNSYECLITTDGWATGNYQIITQLKNGDKHLTKLVIIH